MELTMEMNLDLAKVSRSGYTFIDVLSDIGGIQGLLISVIVILISILNYNHFDDYMATRLFKAKPKNHKRDKGMQNEPTELQPTFYFNSCLYFADLIPAKLRCCKKSRRQRSLEKARQIMDEEFNVIQIIKSRRYVSKAIALLLSKAKR